MSRIRSEIVLGVDPGTAVTGYGVLARHDRELRLLECGVIRTSARDALPVRIREVYEGIVEVIERHHPTVVSVEDVYYGKNARSALTLGQTRGAILLAASLHDVRVAEYTAPQIKKSVVGTGRATKAQVGFMVQQILRLASPPSPEDAADGVAAALCHCMGGPVEGV